MLTRFKWAILAMASITASYGAYRAIPGSCVDMTVTAYWVQAIGSIAAIYWAARIASRQAETARIDRKRAHLETALATLRIAGRIRDEAMMAAQHARVAINRHDGSQLPAVRDRIARIHANIEILFKNNVDLDVLNIVLQIHSQTGAAFLNMEAVIVSSCDRNDFKEPANTVVENLSIISSDLAACTQRIACELSKIS